MNNPIINIKKLQLTKIVLPSEHGGWSLVLEPVVLGLLVAYSLIGLLLGLSFLFLFLLRHPLRLVIADIKKKRLFIRTYTAGIVSAIYFIISTFFFITAIIQTNIIVVYPILFAVPFFMIYVIIDIFIQKRALLSELSGPLALGSIAPSIAMANDWLLFPALGLWAIIIFRLIPSIFYIRVRLDLEKGKQIDKLPTLVLHILSIIIALLLIQMKMIPFIVITAYIILLIRAYIGLSNFRKPTPTQKIGFMEITYGGFTILLAATGYIFKI